MQINAHLSKARDKFAFLKGNFRLLLAWPLIALAVGLIGWYSLFKWLDAERQKADNAALKESATLARGYAEQLERTIATVDQILLHVRYEWELTNGKLRLDDTRKKGLFPASALFNVGINGWDGRLITNTLDIQPNEIDNDRTYFLVQQNARSDFLYVGEAAFGRSSRYSVVHFSRRLAAKDGSFAGVVRVSVPPEYLTADYDDVSLGSHGLMAIAGTDHAIRASRVGPTVYSWNNQALKTSPALNSESGSALLRGTSWFADGRNRYVGWQKVHMLPLIAMIGLDEQDMLAPYNKVRRDALEQAWSNTLALVVFTLIAMALTLCLAWRKHQAESTRTAYRLATEVGNEGFYIFRALYDQKKSIVDFELVDCNQNGADFLHKTRADAVGKRLSELYADGQRDQVMNWLIAAMERGIVEDEVQWLNTSSNESRWFHLKMVRSNEVLAVTVHDITESKEHVLALERKGNEDALTGLPNRHWLNMHLPEAIRRAAADHTMLAILFIDLDGFKTVNDTMGHEAGDELLRNASRRLKLAVRPHDWVVRIGGDEFVVIIDNIASKTDVTHVAERVLHGFQDEFKLAKGVATVGTSIGISVYPADGANAETLLKHADVAMYSVKTSGKRNYRFFNQQFFEAMRARYDKEAELRYAIAHDHDQLILHYQPRIDISTGMTCSLEALVRWSHPVKGLIEPLEFIPFAEETGLISQLGEVVIDKVCAQLAHWSRGRQELVPVSINISPRHFNEANVAEALALSLARHKVEARLVEIELTESTMAGDTPEITNSLNAIQSMGVNLSVDDFGTGYSSLSQLHRLDFDVLKVDRAFTAELEKTKEGMVFFTAIITMAHALGMRVVAEGVETVGQIRKLKELRCDEIQGFYISRPLPPTDTQPILPKWFLPSMA